MKLKKLTRRVKESSISFGFMDLTVCNNDSVIKITPGI
jgi:hypothetical protein